MTKIGGGQTIAGEIGDLGGGLHAVNRIQTKLNGRGEGDDGAGRITAVGAEDRNIFTVRDQFKGGAVHSIRVDSLIEGEGDQGPSSTPVAPFEGVIERRRGGVVSDVGRSVVW